MPSNVMIGMYCNELARFSETYASLMALERPDGTRFVQNYHASLARSQNEIAEIFLESPCEYLFLTNDDHLYPPDTLKRLMAHKKDIVSGTYLRRSLPFEPVMFGHMNEQGRVQTRHFNTGDKGLVQVEACGGGCLLLHRRVLEKAEPPWWNLGTLEPDLISEDVSFSKLVTDAGFEIWVDLDVRIGHMILMAVWPYVDGGNWSTMLRQGQMGIQLDATTAMSALQVAAARKR